MKYLLLLIVCTNVLAQDVVTIKKGEPAPFDGVLFTKEKELQIRKEVTEKDYLQKQVNLLAELGKVQDQEIDVLNKRVVLYRTEVVEYANREVKAESRQFWEHALYFTAGALLTGVLGYGVIQAYK